MKTLTLVAVICITGAKLVAQEPIKNEPPKVDVKKFIPPKQTPKPQYDKDGNLLPPPPPKVEVVKFDPPVIVKSKSVKGKAKVQYGKDGKRLPPPPPPPPPKPSRENE